MILTDEEMISLTGVLFVSYSYSLNNYFREPLENCPTVQTSIWMIFGNREIIKKKVTKNESLSKHMDIDDLILFRLNYKIKMFRFLKIILRKNSTILSYVCSYNLMYVCMCL